MLLVFRREDLCEAKHETSSVFKFSDNMSRSDVPPRLKLSVTADQVLPDLCLQSEPIQNSWQNWVTFPDEVYPQMSCPQLKLSVTADQVLIDLCLQ